VATNRTRIEIDPARLDAVLAEAIGKTLLRIGATAKARAQQIVTSETSRSRYVLENGKVVNQSGGRLAASIDFRIEREGNAIVLVLESTAGMYALYQHEGTGIYGTGKGASRQPIRPRRAKFLVFADPKTGEVIRAKEVRGTPAKKFLTRGVDFALKRVLG
jgi:hypothetical protein